jgi:ABC-type Fe3+ transport system substrate-binding protein
MMRNCETGLTAARIPIGKHDFMGRIPVPLKYTFRDGFEKIIEKYRAKTGRDLVCYFPMGSGGNASLDAAVRAKDIGEFPGMLLSSAFDSAFENYFLEKYVKNGYFQSCQKTPLAQIYCDCAISDPLGAFTVYAVVPIVMLVDRKRLGLLPVPRYWRDILEPVYRKKIIFGGWRKNDHIPYSEFNNFLLLDLYRNYGPESLKAFAQNVKNLLHNVYMPRIAGTDSNLGAAIYILPWFLASICPRRENVSVVWPEDGALAYPLYFLAKKSELKRIKPLVEYVTGNDFGQYLSDNRYPSLNPEVVCPYSPAAKLKWVGWDYIYSNNVMEVMRLAAKTFFADWRPDPIA